MATTIVLSPETEARLDFLASETGRSKSLLLRETVERGMEDIEDYYLSIHSGSRTHPRRQGAYLFVRRGEASPCLARLSTPTRLAYIAHRNSSIPRRGG